MMLAWCPPAGASHGDLDPAFGAGAGKVEHEIGGGAAADDAVLLPDGRTVLAGTLTSVSGPSAVLVARLTSTGMVEATGSTAVVGSLPDVTSVAVLPDGGIAVGGSFAVRDGDTGAFVARFTSALALDPSFDGDGVWRSSEAATGPDAVGALAVDGAGRLVGTGTLTPPSDACTTQTSGFCDSDLVVLRFDAAGLDAGFGAGGIARFDLAPGWDDEGFAVTVQPDGRIVATGEARTSGSSTEAVVVRLTDGGALDTTFGSAGTSRPVNYYTGFWRGTAIAVLADGRMLLGASVGGRPFVSRLTAAGHLDGGWQSPILDGHTVVDVVPRSDGRVVVGLRSWMMLATRLLPDGSVDQAFLGPSRSAIGTSFHTYHPSGDERLAAVLVRPDGRIVFVGSTVWTDDGATTFHYAVAAAQFLQDVPSGAPTQVSASAGDGTATVTWGPPSDTGGLPVDAYIVAVAPGGEVRLPATARAFRADGLANGTSYRFRVRAVTGMGDGASATSAPVVPAAPPPPPPPPPPAPNRQGYWMVGGGGAVYAFGSAPNHGGGPGPAPFVDLEPTPSGNGYWRVTDRGHVYTSGDARWFGGTPGLLAGELVTSLSRTPGGDGYWLFTTAGRVLPYGNARSFGDMSGTRLNGPVLDSIPTPSGSGYYMVASDGGIFTFGDAVFRGSMGAVPLNAPVQSLVPDPDGAGYWLVASDGGIFAFDAAFHGSMGGTTLNRPVTGMVGFSGGYLMVAEDGGIFTFGDAPFFGSLGDAPPLTPIVSVAVLDQP
jgi:uncharacterized delta-60 repeat protein